MSHRMLVLVVLAGCLPVVLGCGGSAAPSNGGATDVMVAPNGQPRVANATAGVREEAGQTTRGRGRSASGLDVVIVSCSWRAGDDLDLRFTIENTENVLRFGNYRLHNSAGLIYRPPGVKSDISVPPGESREYAVSTDKFPRGSDDVSLVVSDSRRESHSIPLEGCAQP